MNCLTNFDSKSSLFSTFSSTTFPFLAAILRFKKPLIDV
jgi:hypothetical protein